MTEDRPRTWCSRCIDEFGWPPKADDACTACSLRIKGAMDWVSSSASNPRSNRIELSKADGWVLVRDSKDPAGPMLRFTWAEIDALFEGAAMGEFDHLAD